MSVSETKKVTKSRLFRDNFEGSVNTEHEQIYKNIRSNIRRQLPQLAKHPANDYTVAMLCGGPSLAGAKIPRGYKVATCNGTYQWALDHGFKPSLFMMLDARPHNVRFVENPIDSCLYYLQSQVDPCVFDALKDHDVRIFHAVGQPEKKILDRYYAERWINVPGGSTIGTRAFGLLYMLGVRKVMFYGLDGCLAKGKHHAYPQPENDADRAAQYTVRVGRRTFRAYAWMIAQADDFIQMIPHLPKDLEVGIDGDGMIAHIVNETARTGGVPPRITVGK